MSMKIIMKIKQIDKLWLMSNLFWKAVTKYGN